MTRRVRPDLTEAQARVLLAAASVMFSSWEGETLDAHQATQSATLERAQEAILEALYPEHR